MTSLLDSFDQNESEWKQTRFFASAHNNILYFQDFVDETLLEAPSSEVFSTRLRRAMYAETTASWQRQGKANFTKHILPIWCETQFEQPLSKATETVLIKSCFTQNYTRSFLARHSTSEPTCRLCKNAPETIEHLFLYCPEVDTEREKLKKAMDGKEFNLKSILGTKENIRSTEVFISRSNFSALL